MIRTPEGLDVTLQQMHLMHRMLADIHARFASTDYRTYKLYAEGPIDEILKMRRDVDAYLGITAEDIAYTQAQCAEHDAAGGLPTLPDLPSDTAGPPLAWNQTNRPADSQAATNG